MNDEQILKMVSDLVGELDYDYWKEIFLEDYADTEDQKDSQASLVNVARTHIEAAWKEEKYSD